jgi:hypothetical protein
VHEEGLVERPERTGVVAGGLGRDVQPVPARVVDGGDDVELVDGEHDRRRLLLDDEIEGLPCAVPVLAHRGTS